jgi:hypothetical protein
MNREEPSMKLRLALVALPLVAGACANTLMSDDRIRSNTATALGVPADQVTISDRRYDGMTNTYYTATAARRSYSCTVNGGTALSLGVMNPAQCSPK